MSKTGLGSTGSDFMQKLGSDVDDDKIRGTSLKNVKAVKGGGDKLALSRKELASAVVGLDGGASSNSSPMRGKLPPIDGTAIVGATELKGLLDGVTSTRTELTNVKQSMDERMDSMQASMEARLGALEELIKEVKANLPVMVRGARAPSASGTGRMVNGTDSS